MHESLAQVAARLRIPTLAEIAVNEPRFAQVEFMIEGNAFVQRMLQKTFQINGEWHSDPDTIKVGLGQLIGHNLAVDVNFAQLNGHTLMFVNPVGDLVDYKRIEQFINEMRELALDARPGSTPIVAIQADDFHRCLDRCCVSY